MEPVLCTALAAATLITGRIPLTHAQNALVGLHLRRIVNAGWGQVTGGDLYHGHIILRPQPAGRTSFRSLDELWANTALLLYHSDEQLRNWRLRDGDLPIAQRAPRSIAGTMDGSIRPAASLVPDPFAVGIGYEFGGTLTSTELARALPEQLEVRRDWIVQTSAGPCLVNLQIDFYQLDGGPLDTTMDCQPAYH